jgi:hypothetical protein
MKHKIVLLTVFVSLCLMVSHANSQKLTAEQIISKHLDSIASAEKRATYKSLIAVGEVSIENIVPKNQPYSGRIVIASEGSKLFAGLSLNAVDYKQEKVVFDGEKTSVALVRSGNRSVVGSFIQSNSLILSHGLFSGTLGTSWTFLNAGATKAKISTAGTKKINGREAYGVSYSPKGGSDLDIKLYFDQETFRHVRTEYSRTSSASMGRTMDESARNSETRIKFFEDFSDFKETNGVTLPQKYKVSYSVSGGSATEIQWNCVFTEFSVNQKLDAGTFALGN